MLTKTASKEVALLAYFCNRILSLLFTKYLGHLKNIHMNHLGVKENDLISEPFHEAQLLVMLGEAIL